MKKFSILSIFFILSTVASFACTNFLFTKSTTTDGSTMITYAADAHVIYGELYHWPAADYPEGTMLDVIEWDTGKFLGRIPQVAHTYNVVGNMNEHQLAIGETTYGGRKELYHQDGAIIDYGSLIYITLQRAKSAREAIKTMANLVKEHGYYSSGESFSIADKDEVWIMELIGKGNEEKGAVWVARMIPDGYVSGHANQARITTFPQSGNTVATSDNIDDIFNKEVTTVYSSDVISFAKKMGFYPQNASDKDFSFSDSYAPVDFGGARFCELRVWAMFNKITDGMDQYFEYGKGDIKYDDKGYATNRMPLWVKPNKKVDPKDVMDLMRDHLENTELDMSKDVGAGPFGNPYRWRPMTWEVDGVKYCHERTTSTQQTGFSFVSQSRNWLPDEIGGIIWFGVDDTAFTCYFPMYTSATDVPYAFAEGNGDIMDFTNESAFWVFNQISNFGYTRYSYIHPEVKAKQDETERGFLEDIKTIDKNAKYQYDQGNKAGAVQYLTSYSKRQGNAMVDDWRRFYGYLFAKYMDGNIKTKVPNKKNPKVEQPGYSNEYYKSIIEQTGDKLKMKE
ncbi:dipeptidase [Balneicella halophila]|uniref:Dipeptidase n=1 Tax=Balneicella halophila TaxID=1537566 RepID=A0A7L4UPP5_BALHA|nr:C69 family dipeptidase [Balneicella halophila]PVX50023.1 dipeptidase [Balneicella halophila]